MANIQIKIPNWLDKICAWPVVEYRRRKFGYPFRKIDLGDGVFTIVEPQDYYRLANFKWYLNGSRGKFYAVRSVKVDSTCTKTIKLHREIMNFPVGLLVDHRNGDSLNNHRSNLRTATRRENAMNRPKLRKSASQYKGVRYRKEPWRKKPWWAVITVFGKKISLGCFLTELEAARAYDAAAKKYHGDFAKLNFPERSEAPSVLICEALSFGLHKSAGGGNPKSGVPSVSICEAQRSPFRGASQIGGKKTF